MKHPLIRTSLILLGLLLIILTPVWLNGQYEVQQAEQAFAAGQYPLAAGYYQRAARHFFWRDDLSEQAGIAAWYAGDEETALSYLNESNLSPAGRLTLGDIYFQRAELESAREMWETLRTDGEASAALYQRLATLYFYTGEQNAEMNSLRQLLGYQPENANAHYRLGLLLSISSPENALDELIAASLLDVEYAPVVDTMRTALNIARLEDSVSEKLILVGRALGLVGEWQLAADAFERATQADPENASAWAWFGEAQQHLGIDGLSALDQALHLDSNSILVRSLRGLYRQRQGDSEGALTEFRAAADAEPDNPAWQAALGDAFSQVGDLPPALEAYQRATTLAPKMPLYWRLLAIFCVQHNFSVVEEGLEAALRAVELAPKDVANMDTLGWVYLSLGERDNAQDALLEAIALDDNYASAHLHLGILYLQKSHTALAYTHLTRARNLADGSASMEAEKVLMQYFPE